MVEEGPLCVFQTQISPEYLHEHTKPYLLVEDEMDEQLKYALHSNPYFYDDCNQHDERSCFPLCFSSFDFLKQRLRVSNQTHKIEGMNNVMAF